MQNTPPAVPARKPHREFFRVLLEADARDDVRWTPVAGFEGRISELILADNLDTQRQRGSRTRLARWQPGTLLPTPVVHDFHEEVFLVSGDLVVGCDAHGNGGERFRRPHLRLSPARRAARPLHQPRWLRDARVPVLRLTLLLQPHGDPP